MLLFRVLTNSASERAFFSGFSSLIISGGAGISPGPVGSNISIRLHSRVFYYREISGQ
jgi:hypothetical protein